jgi:hypothetical protein
MVVAARRQTAAFIQEIESSGFLPKAATSKFHRAFGLRTLMRLFKLTTNADGFTNWAIPIFLLRGRPE